MRYGWELDRTLLRTRRLEKERVEFVETRGSGSSIVWNY